MTVPPMHVSSERCRRVWTRPNRGHTVLLVLAAANRDRAAKSRPGLLRCIPARAAYLYLWRRCPCLGVRWRDGGTGVVVAPCRPRALFRSEGRRSGRGIRRLVGELPYAVVSLTCGPARISRRALYRPRRRDHGKERGGPSGDHAGDIATRSAFLRRTHADGSRVEGIASRSARGVLHRQLGEDACRMSPDRPGG